jgi:NAD(P)-dependent dehydrogenase (short-subunit alcohol dehydrogenase family)
MKNLFSVEGKVALVTGGTSGIGAMIARGYVENGVRTYVASRKAEACEATARELSAQGECIALPGDLSTPGGVLALAREMAEREPQLDILVNNAGATWGAPLAEYPVEAWDKVFNLNVRALFLLTRELAPCLEAAGTLEDPARVIQIGSVNGLTVPPLETYAYSASKAAVHHLTRVLARRLAPKITVNAVAPGAFQSRMMAQTLEAFGDELAGHTPRKRIGTPEDMAGVALYLASRAGAYVTGAVIPVDGGVSTCV